MNRNATVAMLAALLLVASAVAPAPVAAESSSDSAWSGFFADDGAEGFADDVGLWIADQSSTVMRLSEKYLGDEEANASTYAGELTEEVNQNNETLREYVNQRADLSSNYSDYVVYVHDVEGNNVSVYIDGEVTDGNFTSLRALNASEWNDTGETVDHHVSLDWYQSKHAASELDNFVETYAEPNKSVPKSFQAKLIAKYGMPESDMWGDSA